MRPSLLWTYMLCFCEGSSVRKQHPAIIYDERISREEIHKAQAGRLHAELRLLQRVKSNRTWPSSFMKLP